MFNTQMLAKIRADGRVKWNESRTETVHTCKYKYLFPESHIKNTILPVLNTHIIYTTIHRVFPLLQPRKKPITVQNGNHIISILFGVFEKYSWNALNGNGFLHFAFVSVSDKSRNTLQRSEQKSLSEIELKFKLSPII